MVPSHFVAGAFNHVVCASLLEGELAQNWRENERLSQSFSILLESDAVTLERFTPMKLYSSLCLSDRVHAMERRSWKSREFD